MPTFEQYPVASWTVGGRRLAFPVVSVDQSGGNRLVKRNRPYRDGAKVDDTGSVERTWELACVFEAGFEEPGTETNGIPLYPDVVNALVASFDTHETGDLVVPTIGSVRARAEIYRRHEDAVERDSATLSLTFVEDNEESIDATALNPPTVRANARLLAEQTTFDAQSAGSWDQSLSDLETAMGELEALVNTPEAVAAEMDRRVERVRDLGKYAVRIVRERIRGPDAERTERKILREREMAGRSRLESRGDLEAPIISIVVGRNTSLLELTVLLVGQSFADLVGLNPDVDPLFVPRGALVRVRAATRAA